ncbi:hypothetical protein GCM10022403_065320 [Streptomyces coacervatus]|uniref:Uncharacterized protein n=1 Tax=Streptomyces coacervatus TaxID=647381 RepID=A0ABP7INM4_9ACTN
MLDGLLRTDVVCEHAQAGAVLLFQLAQAVGDRPPGGVGGCAGEERGGGGGACGEQGASA